MHLLIQNAAHMCLSIVNFNFSCLYTISLIAGGLFLEKKISHSLFCTFILKFLIQLSKKF